MINDPIRSTRSVGCKINRFDMSSTISIQDSSLIKVHTPTLYSGCLGLVADEGRDKLR
jgi:hypothetical protein